MNGIDDNTFQPAVETGTIDYEGGGGLSSDRTDSGNGPDSRDFAMPGDLLTREDVDAARDTFQFTAAEVRGGIDTVKPLTRALGFDDREVNDYYGFKPDNFSNQFASHDTWANSDDVPSFEDYWTSGVWKDAKGILPRLKNARDATETGFEDLRAGLWGGGLDDAPTFKDAWNKGWWSAASQQIEMRAKGITPPPMESSDDMPILQQWVYQAAQMYGELPLEMESFLVGGPEMAVAVPAAARKAVAEIYQNGAADTPKDALRITRDAALEGFEQYLGLKLLGVAGRPFDKLIQGEVSAASETLDRVLQSNATKVMAAVAKLPAQAAAMTAYFAALERHIPSGREFWNAVTMLAPWHVAGEPSRTGSTDTPPTEEAPFSDEENPAPGHPSEAFDAVGGAGEFGPPTKAAAEAEAETETSGTLTQVAGNDSAADARSGVEQAKASPALVLNKLFNIWVEAGRRPVDVLRDAHENPLTWQELLSDTTELPSQYRNLQRSGGRGDAISKGDDAEGASAAPAGGDNDVGGSPRQSVPGEGPKRTYQTYTKVHIITGQVYSGRTSGFGSPEENILRRDADHHMNESGFGPAKLDRSSESYEAIRGREQYLIERHGGAQSQVGGTSGNRYNGISARNKKGAAYKREAELEFGRQNKFNEKSAPKPDAQSFAKAEKKKFELPK